jgi:Flp pilus assembly protein TadG
MLLGRSSIRQPARRRLGVAAVEFAIVAPLIVTIVVGLMEITRGIMVTESLDDAARMACRSAIQYGSSNTAVKSDVTTALTNAGLPAANATVTIQVNGNTVDVSTAQRYDKISVLVSMPASQVFWFHNLFPTNFNLQSETVTMMRQQ